MVPFGTHKSHFVRISHALTARFPVTCPVITRSVLGTFRMKMTVRAGAFALAAFALLLNGSLTQASEFNAMNGEQAQPSASINIARIKSVLKLTAAQEPYWAPVEAALRDLARQQARSESPDGLVHRISHRV